MFRASGLRAEPRDADAWPTLQLEGGQDPKRSLVIQGIESVANRSLTKLIAGPPLLRADASLDPEHPEGYRIKLMLLRWREYVLERRAQVDELVLLSIAKSYPAARVSIIGWWFLGDASRPAGEIRSDEVFEGGSIIGRSFPSPEAARCGERVRDGQLRGDGFERTVAIPADSEPAAPETLELIRLNF